MTEQGSTPVHDVKQVSAPRTTAEPARLHDSGGPSVAESRVSRGAGGRGVDLAEGFASSEALEEEEEADKAAEAARKAKEEQEAREKERQEKIEELQRQIEQTQKEMEEAAKQGDEATVARCRQKLEGLEKELTALVESAEQEADAGNDATTQPAPATGAGNAPTAGGGGAAPAGGGGGGGGQDYGVAPVGGGAPAGGGGYAPAAGGGGAAPAGGGGAAGPTTNEGAPAITAQGDLPVPHGRAQIEQVFGPPGKNIVSVEMPAGPGGKMVSVQCNAKIAPKLKAVFEEIKEKGLSNLIHTFDGCYNYRPKRGGSDLSTHSWGISVDINASENPMGQNYQTAGQRQLAEIFAKYGFKQVEGDYMHFQYCSGY